jgi:hypothetical protein
MRFGVIATWWACGALLGCSPYVYSEDIATFSGKMAVVSAAYHDNAANIEVERRLRDRVKWTQTRPEIVLGSGCHPDRRSDRPPCALIEKGFDATAKSSPAVLVAPTAPPNKRTEDVCKLGQNPKPKPTAATVAILTPVQRADILKVIARYAAGLAAVTNAKDREEFDAAAAKVSEAVGSLTQSAGAASGFGVAAGPLAKASTNIALWFVGQSLDYRRLEELRIATQEACEPVHALAMALEFMLEEQRGNRLDGLLGVLGWRVRGLNLGREHSRPSDQTYALAVNDAQAAVAAFETVRGIDPAGLAAALSKAHDSLVLAVRHNDGQLDALVVNLQAFGDRVGDLAAAAKAAGASALKQ